MLAIARLGAPVRCLGLVPMSENMPDGLAIKPGDVLTSAEGKTVEILNTDAEGRLVLGDALWYARQLGATHLVDVATLTGAVRRGARQDHDRAVRHAADVGGRGARGERGAPATAPGRCRSSTTTSSS